MAPPVSFDDLFTLETIDDATFRAISATYPWGQVYGGQVAAQGLLAAGVTVDPSFAPHSLHAYFVRTGTFDEPIVYEVDRIRDGRSFATRRVLARQSHGVILNLSASFQRVEDEPEAQRIEFPTDAPAAGSIPMDTWIPGIIERSEAAGDPPKARTWIRLVDDYADTPLMHAVAHTYTSDDLPTEAVEIAHPLGRVEYGDDDAPRQYFGASLDHAVWFHHLKPATDWILHDFRSSGVRGGRGHSTGELWHPDGTHIATVTQEVLLRVAR
ncbi:MAG: acyl-CoA thioesterase domain-containing protein [Actinomycetota bacterium]